jgi:molybdate transport system substrate-binding protein
VTTRPARGLATVALLAVLVSCSASDGSATATSGTLRVFAASSLTDAFTAIADELWPPDGAHVELQFAGSATLAAQLDEGAEADVVATADASTMAAIVEAGDAVDPRPFARNRLALVVEAGNPRAIDGLDDLDDRGDDVGDLLVAVCAPQVPCGRLTAAALDAAGVTLRPTSLEDNVRAVVAKVALGEVDAGIVFVTDARAAAETGDADVVELHGAAAEVESVYAIAVVTGDDTTDDDGSMTRRWIDLVLSDAGRRVLARFGFAPP